MHQARAALPIWLAAAWAFSLTVLGLLVVPMLFAYLPSPAIAGNMAARLFSGQTWVSVVCAMGLLLIFRSQNERPEHAKSASRFIVWVLGGLLLALLVEFAVAPRIVARENLRLWHGVGSAMYFGQWLCSLAVLARLTLRPSA